MPCQSEYLRSDDSEKRLSRLFILLDEIHTGVTPDPHSSDWDGYDSRVYNKSIDQEQADRLTIELCEYCRNHDISNHSLELQIWYREHKKSDERRLEIEKKNNEINYKRKQVLSKLTKEEKELLGIINK
jgi:hypothetical protein